MHRIAGIEYRCARLGQDSFGIGEEQRFIGTHDDDARDRLRLRMGPPIDIGVPLPEPPQYRNGRLRKLPQHHDQPDGNRRQQTVQYPRSSTAITTRRSRRHWK